LTRSGERLPRLCEAARQKVITVPRDADPFAVVADRLGPRTAARRVPADGALGENGGVKRLRYAPKLPLALVARLYRSDALVRRDQELLDDVGWRLYVRCRDVLLVSDSRAACPECRTAFEVPWIGQPEERPATCPGCGWRVTAGEYHASWRHHDLLGGNARSAFAAFVERFPAAATYEERMLLIDRLVHAVHTTGGLAARNLFEGRPRRVVQMLDALASGAQL